ncbi:D-alanyl-D-alanine carboxypeptidase family protein [Clostridium celatum]|uniref:Serine-type D-Ala-D-Ala carboxypeptidase n=1 Tax=Clostridium celatum DSM 1785 TaxID=545697 RepID=L1QDX3_9CLOT|nr:D-alanyl-D-alanine carboxypeptidase family protein [Clostridium celatum]EKY26151.1 serine-type D-Ala-D-Ala carboxypeptidase [Clostridium celatum DSM 1785]MCE9654292.1 D-alanyl-D-alanine carboxypeptidase [Clostridium celatum]MDU3721766.1 D-alanyl-D-alanine carboxypeptidase family protein [Clostridium celatum]MDU6297228.1 D-alanyl-D-alanine carboxypeptidase family protein [Clostridium celatum]MDY3358979.1 D-alanyl-D-alanine carboxypeptidase family protein [Clostridium celatum]
MRKNFFKTIVLFICLTLIVPFISTVNVFAATNDAPQIIGESAITMDLDTGEIIYSKNADVKRSPASTTKLLTSLIFAENKSKSDLIPYTDTSASLTETTLSGYLSGGAKPGDTMTADDVMKAVMIFSANDASIMMAESVAGSVDAFAAMMNEKAKELGAVNSNFINPNGLEVNNTTHNVTTAYDLALIGKAAYQNDWIRETMELPSTSVSINDAKIIIDTRNKNLGKDGNVGGKTGTETMAGHCFVGYYTRDGRNLITVVLGSEYGAEGINVFNDTKSIADYSYNAEKVPFKTAGTEIGTTELEYKLFRFFGPTKTITAPVVLDSDIMYYDNDYNSANAKIELSNTDLDAWKVASNNTVDLTFSIAGYNETVQGSVQLSTGQLLKANFPIYAAAVLAIIIAIVLIVVIVKLISKSNRRNRRSRYYR